MRGKTQRMLTEFVVAFVIWMLLSWTLKPGYSGFSLQNILGGVVAAGLCAFFFGNVFPHSPAKIFNPRRLFWFLVFLPDFIWYCFMANLDVAYRVLNINMPIRPGIVKVKTRLKSEMGKAFLANSITLTPGTLTVDIIDDTLYVHWIYVSTEDPQEQTKKIVSRFEYYLIKVFD